MASAAILSAHPGAQPAHAVSCEYCDSTQLCPHSVRHIGSFWRCEQCGLLQMGTPAERDVVPWVDWASPLDRASATWADIRLSRLANLLAMRRPRLLDVAHDRSPSVERASELGWLAAATLANARAVASYRQRGLDVYHAPPSVLPFPTDYFDVVTAWFTLEQVPNVRVALREWQRVLRPGGVLALEVHCSAALERAGGRGSLASGMRYGFHPAIVRGLVGDAEFELLANPGLGRLELLDWRAAVSTLWYQTRHSLQRLCRRSTTYQLFCRRPVRHTRTVDLQRVA